MKPETATAKWVEWAGTVTGVIGAALLAMNTSISGWGFVAFLASNALWLSFGIAYRCWGMVTQQIAFTATSVLGIVRWLA